MAKPLQATWNREDRDLLVELRTNMATIVKQMTSMDITMKEINAGYSSRLLALESNAVCPACSGSTDKGGRLEVKRRKNEYLKCKRCKYTIHSEKTVIKQIERAQNRRGKELGFYAKRHLPDQTKPFRFVG
jgi:tRNA(Ile2) C34 agmatinyltransferase TiaS